MNIITDTTKYSFPESVVMLGKFDGVHLGHQTLIKKGVEIAKEKCLSPIVYTFEGKTNECLTTDNEKVNIFESLGAEYIVFEKFTDEFKSITPQDFVKNILVGTLNAKHIVVGFNYRFGKGASGDTEFLKKLCDEQEIGLTVIEPFEINSNLVSSTIIRTLIRNGDVKTASRYLGRNYTLSGVTSVGKGLGHTLGFATANLLGDFLKVLPKRGVYVTKTYLNGKAYMSMTNVGINPTVEDGRTPKIETHLINFSDEIYGENIGVEFVDFIRDEKKFDSVGDLKSQLETDRDYVIKYF